MKEERSGILDKERQILLQMLSTKKLPGEVKNNKLNNQSNLKTEEKKKRMN